MPNVKRVIFRQLRIGYKDNPFWIYKIRTMDNEGNVTRIGKFFRITGLDELPQIINILKGDIVLIGPRPLTPQDHKKFRGFPLLIKPGLTGWWQIHGRIQEKIRQYDLEYIEKKSLWLDLYIIWKTIPLILFAKHG